MTPREELYRLVELFTTGKMGTQSFCDVFEETYNLKVDKGTLSKSEAAAFGGLFDKVVWYSPFPEEREQIPNYLGDREIAAAVHEAAKSLGVSGLSNEKEHRR